MSRPVVSFQITNFMKLGQLSSFCTDLFTTWHTYKLQGSNNNESFSFDFCPRLFSMSSSYLLRWWWKLRFSFMTVLFLLLFMNIFSDDCSDCNQHSISSGCAALFLSHAGFPLLEYSEYAFGVKKYAINMIQLPAPSLTPFLSMKKIQFNCLPDQWVKTRTGGEKCREDWEGDSRYFHFAIMMTMRIVMKTWIYEWCRFFKMF